MKNNEIKENDDLNTESEDFNFKKGRFQIFFKIFVVLCAISFFVGIGLIVAFQDEKWPIIFAISGPALILLTASIARLIRIIYIISHPKQTIESVKAVVNVAKSAGGYYKRKFSTLSKKHKIQVLLIFGSFALFILFMIVGVFIANFIPQYKTVGFVFMGISGGGTVLWILTMIIASVKN